MADVPVFYKRVQITTFVGLFLKYGAVLNSSQSAFWGSQKFSCGSQPVLIEFSKVLFFFGDVFRAGCLNVPVPWLAQVRFRAVVNVFVNTFMVSLCVYKTVYTGCELFSYSLQNSLQLRMGAPMCLQNGLHRAVGCLRLGLCAFPADGGAGLFCCMILARFYHERLVLPGCLGWGCVGGRCVFRAEKSGNTY